MRSISAPWTGPGPNPRRIAAMFVATMALTLAGIGAFLIKDMRDAMEARLIDGVERRSEQAAAQLGANLFLLLQQLGGGPDDLRNGANARRKLDPGMHAVLLDRIRALTGEGAIVKVKLFALDGTTVISTAAADVGQMKYAPAFDAAMEGRTSTEINRRDSFGAINGTLRDVVLAASYIPIRWGPTPTAVLETYTDVTADMAGVGAAADARARALTAGFALLFLIIVGVTAIVVSTLSRAIVSRDQQAAARASSETLFEEAIESIADGVLIFTQDQRLLHWNSRLEKIFPHLVGRLIRDMTQRELLELHAASPLYGIPAAERAAWVTKRLRSLQPGRSTPTKVLTDGRVVQGTAWARPSGGFIVAVRDVTTESDARSDIAAARARAEESEHRFRDFAEASSDWFWEAAPDGRLTYLSQGITRFGVTPEQLIGQGRSTLPYTIPKGQAGTALIAAATASRQPFKDVEFEGVLRDGRHVFISVSGRPIFGANEVYLGHRGSGRDITDVTISRRRLEAALAERETQEKRLEAALQTEREAAAQQRRFVAIVAHEFRTPLTIIDGAAQRLARRAAEPSRDEIVDRVERIRRAVARMSQLIDTTLNSARLAAGSIEADRSAINLVEAVTTSLRRQEEMSREFSFGFVADRADIVVEADPRLLDQVFTNLLSNAVKYSGDSRRVEVTIACGAGEARIGVRDFGLGVPAAEIPQLFSRFFRASTAKGVQGTGIGLNLVKELVALHGGQVAVESEVAAGSLFTVTLPLAASARIPDATAAA
jgi:PAS domain S-box-containing protein